MFKLTQLVSVFFIYSLCGWLGIHFAAIGESSLTLIWLPSGIALSAFILYGKQIWPAIWLASFAANTPYLINPDLESPILIACLYGGLAASINTLIQAKFAYYLYQKFINEQGLKTSKLILSFVFKVILAPSILNMSLLIGLYSFGGYIQPSSDTPLYELLTLWLSGVLADFHGYFVIVPFVLSWWTHKESKNNEQFVWCFIASISLILIVVNSLFFIPSSVYLLLE